MIAHSFPSPDDEILQAILITAPEEEMNLIADLARDACDTAMAAVGFVDKKRILLKSKIGLTISELPREILSEEEVTVIPDTAADKRWDERWKNAPYVAGPPHLRFFAAAPIITESGFIIGMVSVMDPSPKMPTPQQRRYLLKLAQVVGWELRHASEQQRAEQQRAEQQRAEQQRAEQQRAEQQRAEQQHRVMLESALDCIVCMDHAGKIIEFNPVAEETFGYTRSDAIGKLMADLIIPPSLREAHRVGLARYLATGAGPVLGKRIEITAMRANGKEFPVELMIVPIPSAIPPRFIGFIRDITERKQAIETEMRARELAGANAELSLFASLASHDLKEPLRTVQSFLALLAKRYQGKLDADADDFIGYAVDGATRMGELIEGLRVYSRIGTHAEAFAPTDCNSVIEKTLDNLRVIITETGAIVTYDPLPTVSADGVQMISLFQNLIANAVKFTKASPPKIHIWADKMTDPDSIQCVAWHFSIKDNGIGIDPKYFDKIFAVFQRLHGKKYPGTGLGLSLCRKIVERHGGRIWVVSREGEGSTFHFTIPILPT